jgi:2-keto-3-deoxy-L-rhamnonate aldolase RhmA
LGFKEMAKSRNVKIGTCVMEFVSPGIGKILKAAGCDFVFFDMEHAGFTFETLNKVLRYMEAARLPVVVRPASKTYHDVAMACDLGAEALLLPHVRSAQEAGQILDWMKYPPEGHRGVALQIAHDDYRPGPAKQKLAESNRRTTLFVTIENRDGLADVEAIAAIDGVDGLWLGHNDLSSSLGIPGEFDHPTFREAADRIRRASLTNGKSYGRVPSSVDEAVELFDSGADMIVCSGDIWLLLEALKGMVDSIRASCTGEAGAKRSPTPQAAPEHTHS